MAKTRRRRASRRDHSYLLIPVLIGLYFAALWLYQHPADAFALLAGLLGLAGISFALYRCYRQRAAARAIFHAQNLTDLLALKPAQFEHAIADLLTQLGYRQVKVLGGSGDLMADITARDPTGRTTVCQCKRYQPGSAIGSPEIQKFIGMTAVHHHAEQAIFVTTSTFTAPARKLAEQHRIHLWDGTELTKRLRSQSPSPLPALTP